MKWDFQSWQRGDRCLAQVQGDDRWLEAVYLGPAGEAVPRIERQIFAIDDGESWKLVMSVNIGGIRTLPPGRRAS